MTALRHRMRHAWRGFLSPGSDLLDMTAARDGYREAWQATCAERDAALRDLAALIAERDSAQADLLHASAERDGYRSAWQAICAERDAVRSDLLGVTAERDGYRGAWQAMCAERDAVRGDLLGVTAERDGYRGAWQATCAERDAGCVANAQLSAECDGYRGAFAAANAEAAALRAEAALFGVTVDVPPDPDVAPLPGVLIVTLPKSGTVYTQAKLTRSFGLRSRQVCHGGFPRAALDAVALRAVAKGGRLAMSHADSSTDNLAAIRDSGLRPVLHLRDPRAATLSMLHHIRAYHADPELRHFLARIGIRFPPGFHDADFGAQLDAMVALYLPAAIGWIEDWLAALDRDTTLAGLVRVTRFETLAGDEDSYLGEVCTHVGLPRTNRDFADVARDGSAHFRQGDDNEWRRVLTPAQIAAATAALPAALRHRMDWH